MVTGLKKFNIKYLFCKVPHTSLFFLVVTWKSLSNLWSLFCKWSWQFVRSNLEGMQNVHTYLLCGESLWKFAKLDKQDQHIFPTKAYWAVCGENYFGPGPFSVEPCSVKLSPSTSFPVLLAFAIFPILCRVKKPWERGCSPHPSTKRCLLSFLFDLHAREKKRWGRVTVITNLPEQRGRFRPTQLYM